MLFSLQPHRGRNTTFFSLFLIVKMRSSRFLQLCFLFGSLVRLKKLTSNFFPIRINNKYKSIRIRKKVPVLARLFPVLTKPTTKKLRINYLKTVTIYDKLFLNTCIEISYTNILIGSFYFTFI